MNTCQTCPTSHVRECCMGCVDVCSYQCECSMARGVCILTGERYEQRRDSSEEPSELDFERGIWGT